MLHFYETNKLGIWNMEMVFLLKKKTSYISFYISFIKWKGNSEEVCFRVWRSVCAFEHEEARRDLGSCYRL